MKVIISLVILMMVCRNTSENNIKVGEKCLDENCTCLEKTESILIKTTVSDNKDDLDNGEEEITSTAAKIIKCNKLDRCILVNQKAECKNLDRVIREQRCQSEVGCECYISYDGANSEQTSHPFVKTSTYCQTGSRCTVYDGEPFCERIIGYGDSCADHGGCECKIDLTGDLSLITENSKDQFKSTIQCPFGSLCLMHEGDATCQRADFLEVKLIQNSKGEINEDEKNKLEKMLKIKFPGAENEDDYALYQAISVLEDVSKLDIKYIDTFIENLPQVPYSKFAINSAGFEYKDLKTEEEKIKFEEEIRGKEIRTQPGKGKGKEIGTIKRLKYASDRLFLIRADFAKLLPDDATIEAKNEAKNKAKNEAKKKMAEMEKIKFPYLKIGDTVFHKPTKKYMIDMGEVCNLNIKKKKVNFDLMADEKNTKAETKDTPIEVSPPPIEVSPPPIEVSEIFFPSFVNEDTKLIKMKNSKREILTPENLNEPNNISKSLICVFYFGSSRAFEGAEIYFGMHVPVFTRLLESKGSLKLEPIDQDTRKEKNLFSYKCKQAECRCGDNYCRENEWCLSGTGLAFCNRINYKYLEKAEKCDNYAGCICHISVANSLDYKNPLHNFLLAGYGTECTSKPKEDKITFTKLEKKSLKNFGEELVLKEFGELASLTIPESHFFSNSVNFYCANSEYCICNMEETIKKGEACKLEKNSPWRVSLYEIGLKTTCTAINGCICNDLTNQEKTITARCVKGETCQLPSKLFKFLHKKIADGLKGVVVYGVDVGGVLSAIPTVMKCSPDYKNYWQCKEQEKCYCAYPFGYCDKDEYCRISVFKNSCSKVEPDLNQTDFLQSMKNSLMFWSKPKSDLI